MTSFTLDTNCLIDLEEDRPGRAQHIRKLLEAADSGKASLALVASSASERQSDNGFLKSVKVFDERRTSLGLGELALLPSIGYFDVSFFGHSLYPTEEGKAREALIYGILFPSSPLKWRDYAAEKGAAEDAMDSPQYLRWRNQLLDAQAYWAHDYAKRDVFVTSDKRFKRLEGYADFPEAVICTPEEAGLHLK